MLKILTDQREITSHINHSSNQNLFLIYCCLTPWTKSTIDFSPQANSGTNFHITCIWRPFTFSSSNNMANNTLSLLGVVAILVFLLYMQLVGATGSVAPTPTPAPTPAEDVVDISDDVKHGSVSLTDCKQECMAICMKIKYAQDSLCRDACKPACKQLQGKASLVFGDTD